MPAQGVIELGGGFRWDIGDGELLGGSVTLTEGKRASSLSFQLADPRGELANDLPLVLIEDVPAQRASVEVTFVAEYGLEDIAFVPAGTVLETDPTDEVLAGQPPDRVQFETDKSIEPGDFTRSDPNTLERARATVTATAIKPGAQGNISGQPDVGDGESLDLQVPIDEIAQVYHTAPATGGRDAGITGEKVPVECWLGRGDNPTPPKVFSGYFSQLTAEHNRVQLMAVDKSSDLRREERASAYNATDLDGLVRRIAARHDLEADLTQADLGDFQLTRHLQHGTTDWGFLNRQMERLGHRVKVRGETLYVTKVGRTREEPQTPIFRPTDISDYRFAVDELTTHTTPNVAAMSGADASEYGDGTRAASRSVQLQRTGVPEGYDEEPTSVNQVAERQAQAEARKHRTFSGSITVGELYPRMDTDDQVILDGFGVRYDGPWWIGSVTLDFAGETSFNLTSDSE